MKGIVFEERKSLQREADASRGSSDCKRVKKKRSYSVERGADASQGGEIGGSSKFHRVKKKRASIVERVADASQGEIGESSEPHRLKCKRVKKKHTSIVERGADASQGEIGGSSKPRRVKKKGASVVQRAIDAAARAGELGLPSEINPFFWRIRNKVVSSRMRKLLKSANLGYAKQALKFYEKKKGAAFEIVEVFYSKLVDLVHPEYEFSQGCVHVSFSAKPKIAGCSDTSLKYFFGELLESYPSMNYKAKYCSTFEPNDDAGFNHGCVFCPVGQKFHPAAGYRVGRLPWYIPDVIWV